MESKSQVSQPWSNAAWDPRARFHNHGAMQRGIQEPGFTTMEQCSVESKSQVSQPWRNAAWNPRARFHNHGAMQRGIQEPGFTTMEQCSVESKSQVSQLWSNADKTLDGSKNYRKRTVISCHGKKVLLMFTVHAFFTFLMKAQAPWQPLTKKHIELIKPKLIASEVISNLNLSRIRVQLSEAIAS